MGRLGHMREEERIALADRIVGLQQVAGRSIAVAIDGPSGAGKSTVAFGLQSLVEASFVLQTDTFHVPLSCAYRMRPSTGERGAMIDWRRYRETALNPIRANEPFKVAWINPFSERLEAIHSVVPGTLVLCDGTFSARAELWEYYDYRILVRCDPQVAASRRIERDAQFGPDWREYVESIWMPDEEAYLAELDAARFDLVLDNV